LSEILVVANETLAGRRLRELLAQKAKINPSLERCSDRKARTPRCEGRPIEPSNRRCRVSEPV
jgi:hypothetical protein